ncbi:MAG: putative toxin-antitoxin system toxin component, PIN family (plasmid) [Candidatus Symbiodolus clandestinus]
MRVVLDTNILFSSLISPHGFPNLIYQSWCKNRFDLITSKVQLDELRRASKYPKFKAVLHPHEVGSMLNTLRHAVVLSDLSYSEEIEADDPNDSFLLAMALIGKADYLVTGDYRAGMLQRNNIARTRIVLPSVFCLNILKIRMIFNKK